MELVKVHFGSQEPPAIDYRPQKDGLAEVWLFRNISHEDTEEGREYSAEGIFFRSAQSAEEILANKDTFFKQLDDPEVTIADIVEAIDILTSIIVEG